jgi:methionine-rich copper-binding protein CopC
MSRLPTAIQTDLRVHEHKGIPMSNFIRIVSVASVLSVAVASQAFAHAHLQSATPAMDSTVKASPAELDLKFSEGLNIKFSGIAVTGPDGKDVKTGDAKLSAGDDTMLVVPVSGTLPAGVYTVKWHALSTDGHKTNGNYSFTVKP